MERRAGRGMGVWRFGDEEFRRWLRERSPYDDPELREPERPDLSNPLECISCLTRLDGCVFSVGTVCGYCLAFEFGVDSQEREVAITASALLKTIAEGSSDQTQLLLRQMIADTRSTLSVIPGRGQ